MRMLDYMEKPMRRGSLFILPVLLFVVCAIALYYVPAEKVVAAVGVENTYVVIMLLGIFAGFSMLTGTSFYATAVAFALGGANPVLLGIMGGLGLFVSDTIFYHVALRGAEFVKRKWRVWPERLAAWVNARPNWAVLGFVYVYAGFIPIPSDIMLAGLALSDYSYRKFWPYLLAGDLTIVILVATFAHQAVLLGLV